MNVLPHGIIGSVGALQYSIVPSWEATPDRRGAVVATTPVPGGSGGCSSPARAPHGDRAHGLVVVPDFDGFRRSTGGLVTCVSEAGAVQDS